MSQMKMVLERPKRRVIESPKIPAIAPLHPVVQRVAAPSRPITTSTHQVSQERINRTSETVMAVLVANGAAVSEGQLKSVAPSGRMQAPSGHRIAGFIHADGSAVGFHAEQAGVYLPASTALEEFRSLIAASQNMLRQGNGATQPTQRMQPTNAGASESSLPSAVASGGGLPKQLKSGIENLSGISMDGVRVHYNSSKPAQISAFAFAQGTDIHLAPGQDKHLPHEAWHIVQQLQNRVRPTTRLRTGESINDDKRLESEAETMGSQAAGAIYFEEPNLRSGKMDARGNRGKPDSRSGNDLRNYHSKSLIRSEQVPLNTLSMPIQFAGHAGVMLFGDKTLIKRVENNEYLQFERVVKEQKRKRRIHSPFPKIGTLWASKSAIERQINQLSPRYGTIQKIEKWLTNATTSDCFVEMENLGGASVNILDFKIGTATADKEELKRNYNKSDNEAEAKVTKMARIDRTTESARYGLRDSDAMRSSTWDAIKRYLGKFTPTLTSVRAKLALDREPYTDDDQAIKDLHAIYHYIQNSSTVYIASSLVMQWHENRRDRFRDRVVLIDLAHPITIEQDGFDTAKNGMLLGIRNLEILLKTVAKAPIPTRVSRRGTRHAQ